MSKVGRFFQRCVIFMTGGDATLHAGGDGIQRAGARGKVLSQCTAQVICAASRVMAVEDGLENSS